MNSLSKHIDTQENQAIQGYNYGFLDEQTKRMIRRAILKAVAIPGYQVPFGGREMPMPYGWGTGGIQITASIIGQQDTLKVIDQGADDTTNAVSIRQFFEKVVNADTTEETEQAQHHSNTSSYPRNTADRRANSGIPSADSRTLALS